MVLTPLRRQGRSPDQPLQPSCPGPHCPDLGRHWLEPAGGRQALSTGARWCELLSHTRSLPHPAGSTPLHLDGEVNPRKFVPPTVEFPTGAAGSGRGSQRSLWWGGHSRGKSGATVGGSSVQIMPWDGFSSLFTKGHPGRQPTGNKVPEIWLMLWKIKIRVRILKGPTWAFRGLPCP